MKTRTKRTSPTIPAFRSHEEEAEFWDTHSPLDFPEEFEDVDVKFATPLQILRGDTLQIVEALSGVPDDEREAIALMLLGLKSEEIARVTGWTSEETRKTLGKARRRMKRFALKV